jgi:hypothetical protein
VRRLEVATPTPTLDLNTHTLRPSRMLHRSIFTSHCVVLSPNFAGRCSART